MNDIAPHIRQSYLSARFVLLFTILFVSTSFSYGQSCSCELTVSKNRNARSANEHSPTTFQLVLTNNSFKSQSYLIETIRYEGSFLVRGENINRLDSSNNLDVAIYKDNNEIGNFLTVPSQSSINFTVTVAVPSGTDMNRWAGIQVNAGSSECSNGEVSTLLKLFVTNSSEE